jgi:hypothetical protein
MTKNQINILETFLSKFESEDWIITTKKELTDFLTDLDCNIKIFRSRVKRLRHEINKLNKKK